MGKYTHSMFKMRNNLRGPIVAKKNQKHWLNIFEDEKISKTPIQGIESNNYICV